MGAVSVDQLGRRFGVGRAVSYALTKRLTDAELLQRVETMPGDPSLIRATKKGIRYVGVGTKPATVRSTEVLHWIAQGDVAIELERRYGSERIRSELEIRVEERHAGKELASVKLGHTSDGWARRHFPDLAVVGGEKAAAIEIELNLKSKPRLDEILGAYRAAPHIGSVVYLCPAGPVKRGVEAGIERNIVGHRVKVRELARGSTGGDAVSDGVGGDR
jgi:hypothetical protein